VGPEGLGFPRVLPSIWEQPPSMLLAGGAHHDCMHAKICTVYVRMYVRAYVACYYWPRMLCTYEHT
jgi:hypothetical protein